MSKIPTKAQMQWQCRRGMLELDFFFERFMNEQFDQLPDADKTLFSKVLTYEDPILFQWLIGAQEPDDLEIKRIIKMIRQD